jgi:TRAP-type C4-dicarboxylate transport system substrate-binding protein
MCATVFVTTMNLAKYNAMPADLRAVIDRNSGIETSGWFGRVMTDGDVTGKQAVVAGGVAVNAIPAAELERWKKATASLDEQWVTEMKGKGVDGDKLLQTARELVRKNTR